MVTYSGYRLVLDFGVSLRSYMPFMFGSLVGVNGAGGFGAAHEQLAFAKRFE